MDELLRRLREDDGLSERLEAADEIERLRAALNRVRTAIFNIQNRTCTPVFVTTEIDLIDAALRGPEKS